MSSSLLSHEEFIAAEKTRQQRLEEERGALMQTRERLVGTHQQQIRERISQFDAFEELLRMGEPKVDVGTVEVAKTTMEMATTRSNAVSFSRQGPHLRETIEELKRLTHGLSQLRRTETYLEILLSLQQSMKHIRTQLTEGSSIETAINEYHRLRDSTIPTWTFHLHEYKIQCREWAQKAIDQVLAATWSRQLTALGWPKSLKGDALQLEALLRTFDAYVNFGEVDEGEGDASEEKHDKKDKDTDEGRYKDKRGAGADKEKDPKRSQAKPFPPYGRLVQVMLAPIRVRFKFHYASDQPTSRLDRPEWYLGHLLQIITIHGPALKELFVDPTRQMQEPGASFLEVFLDGLLDLAREQMITRKEAIQADPFILAHTIQETFVFVRQLNERLSVRLTPDNLLADTLWNTLADVARWLETQGEAAMHTIRSILSGEDQNKRRGLEVEPASVLTLVSAPSMPMAEMAADIVRLLRDLNDTLLNCLPGRLQLDYLHEVIGPILETIYEKIDFEMPPFHHTADDVHRLLGQANLLSALSNYLGKEVGESPEAIELAASDIYRNQLKDEEAQRRDGSIYYRSVASFQELLDRCLNSLHEHLWESFVSPANAFARSMHYGVVRTREGTADTTMGIGMHDEFRRAMVSLATANETVVTALLEEPVDTLQSMLLFSLATWTMDRWLLANYYRVEMDKDGKEDRQCLDQLALDYETFLKFAKDLLGRSSHQPVEAALARCTEAVRLLTLPMDERARLSQSMEEGKEGDKDDDMSVITELLQRWHINHLSIADCERLFSLIKH